MNKLDPVPTKFLYEVPDITSQLYNLIKQFKFWDNQTDSKKILYQDIKSVTSGSDFVIALSHTPNKLYTWGYNAFGQLGLGDHYDLSSIHTIILDTKSPIKSVSCGCHHTLCLLESGKCFSWGWNEEGQLGFESFKYDVIGLPIRAYEPRELVSLSNVIGISCGSEHSATLTKFNKCYIWGDNHRGQLGLGDTRDKHTPQELNLSNIVSISCGAYHTIALSRFENKSVIYAWGLNDKLQLGLGDGCAFQKSPSPLCKNI